MSSYEAYVHLIQQLDDLVGIFEQHPDERTREQAGALLSGLDALHRQGLERLVEKLREVGAGPALEQAADDPVVETLLGLYDLAELDVPEEPPSRPSPPAAGGTQHAPHNGGAAPMAGMPGAAPDGMHSVLGTGTPPPTMGAGFVPRENLKGLPQARWVEIARTAELPPGTMRVVEADQMWLLLVNVSGDVHAFRNACAESGETALPLEVGRLEGDELHCAWHGCRYDARTGRRLDEGEGRLENFPVAVRDGSVELALQPEAAQNGQNGSGAHPE